MEGRNRLKGSGGGGAVGAKGLVGESLQGRRPAAAVCKLAWPRAVAKLGSGNPAATAAMPIEGFWTERSAEVGFRTAQTLSIASEGRNPGRTRAGEAVCAEKPTGRPANALYGVSVPPGSDCGRTRTRTCARISRLGRDRGCRGASAPRNPAARRENRSAEPRRPDRRIHGAWYGLDGGVTARARAGTAALAGLGKSRANRRLSAPEVDTAAEREGP